MKMKYRGTICCDIDGVLADFEKKFCEDFGYASRHLYSLEKRYPEIDPELIKEYVKNPENYRDLAPIFGGLLFCRQAHSRGWYILLVTSRDKFLREVTKQWLAKYGVVYHELVFSRNKREAIEDYDNINPSRKVAIVVDDSPEVIDSMPERFCVAWNQPWNYGTFPVLLYDDRDFKIKIQTDLFGEDAKWKWIWDKVGK